MELGQIKPGLVINPKMNLKIQEGPTMSHTRQYPAY